MIFKACVILLLLMIFVSLGSAMVYLLKSKGRAVDHEHMARALTVRIGLSLLLFVLLMVAFSMGWIHPHGV